MYLFIKIYSFLTEDLGDIDRRDVSLGHCMLYSSNPNEGQAPNNLNKDKVNVQREYTCIYFLKRAMSRQV